MEARSVKSSTAKPFPNDVVEAILSRLPAKSLVRFRSVTRSFTALMRESFFLNLHKANRSSQAGGMVCYVGEESQLQYFDKADMEGNVNSHPLYVPRPECISNFINSLVCLIRREGVSVCNYATGEIITLPDSSSGRQNHCCFLFGYDPLGDQYKVVKIVTKARAFTKRTRKECHVLTLGENPVWRRKINAKPYRFPSYCRTNNVYRLHIGSVSVDGVIYWIHNLYSSREKSLSRFDVREEKFLPGIPIVGNSGNFPTKWNNFSEMNRFK